MKIVQINHTYGDSDSTGRTTKELHKWLQLHGHDSSVFAAYIEDGAAESRNNEVYLFSSATDKKIHSFFSHFTGLQGYFSKISTRQLIKKMERIKPQAIILRVLHSNCINFSMLYKYLSINHIAVILVLHDCWYFTGHCCYYTEAKCQKWMNGCKICPQIHYWNKSWFFDTAAKCLRDKKKWFSDIHNLGVVGVSDWITGEAEKSILKDRAVIRRIYNWINLDVFYPQDTQNFRKELNISKDEVVLLGVAADWNGRKGLKEILLAAKELPAAKIILIGNTSNNVKWPKNILRIGIIKEPELLAKYYAMSDVFLNPSIQETFGKTTAEAICCGTPVVAYNTTACTELVGRGCGKLVELGEKELYLKAVKDILKEGKEKYYLNCLEFAHKNFDQDNNTQEYINLIKELIKE